MRRQPVDIDEATFLDLVRRAGSDGDALETLKTIRSVDGAPIDMAATLGGAEGPVLDARLAELDRAFTAGQTGFDDVDRLREQAGEILADDKFKESTTPKPLEGVVNWIGERVQWFFDLFGPITENAAGRWIVSVLVLGLLAGVTGVLVRRGLRGRQVVPDRPVMAEDLRGLDPSELEGQATELAQRGEFDQAIRLQFAAGVLRLDRAEVIEYRPSVTMGELRRTVATPPFDEVADLFEQVVYGDRTATATDVDHSRQRWAELTAVGSRRS